MNRKITGALIIFVGLVLIVGIIYIMFINPQFFSNFKNKFKKENNININNNNPAEVEKNKKIKKIINFEDNQNQNNQNIEEEKSIIKPVKKFGKDDLMRLASSFSERFGSFSNQSNFGNITDLKMFMSLRMQKWSDDFIEKQRKNSSSRDMYYSIMTKVVSKELIEMNDDTKKASVLIKTRRIESIGSDSNSSDTFSQDIVINFVKEKGVWKVDSATWKER